MVMKSFSSIDDLSLDSNFVLQLYVKLLELMQKDLDVTRDGASAVEKFDYSIMMAIKPLLPFAFHTLQDVRNAMINLVLKLFEMRTILFSPHKEDELLTLFDLMRLSLQGILYESSEKLKKGYLRTWKKGVEFLHDRGLLSNVQECGKRLDLCNLVQEVMNPNRAATPLLFISFQEDRQDGYGEDPYHFIECTLETASIQSRLYQRIRYLSKAMAYMMVLETRYYLPIFDTVAAQKGHFHKMICYNVILEKYVRYSKGRTCTEAEQYVNNQVRDSKLVNEFDSIFTKLDDLLADLSQKGFQYTKSNNSSPETLEACLAISQKVKQIMALERTEKANATVQLLNSETVLYASRLSTNIAEAAQQVVAMLDVLRKEIDNLKRAIHKFAAYVSAEVFCQTSIFPPKLNRLIKPLLTSLQTDDIPFIYKKSAKFLVKISHLLERTAKVATFEKLFSAITTIYNDEKTGNKDNNRSVNAAEFVIRFMNSYQERLFQLHGGFLLNKLRLPGCNAGRGVIEKLLFNSLVFENLTETQLSGGKYELSEIQKSLVALGFRQEFLELRGIDDDRAMGPGAVVVEEDHVVEAQRTLRCLVRYLTVVTKKFPKFTLVNNAEQIYMLKDRNKKVFLLFLDVLLTHAETHFIDYCALFLLPLIKIMNEGLDLEIRNSATKCFCKLVELAPLDDNEIMEVSILGLTTNFKGDYMKGKELLKKLLMNQATERFEMNVTVNAELRSYQQEAVSWLYFLYQYNFNGVLCDEMGLGKTLQTICILASVKNDLQKTGLYPSLREHFALVVCPATLTNHWQAEIKKFCPYSTLRSQIYSGGQQPRISNGSMDVDVTIISYQKLCKSIKYLKEQNFHYIVLDEGHLIKNKNSQVFAAVKNIKAPHKLILTGTPIHNNISELWPLFEFLMPGLLGTDKDFNNLYGKYLNPKVGNVFTDFKTDFKNIEKAEKTLELLQKRIHPFILRRVKKDVLKDLPDKIIQDYICEMSQVQDDIYKEFEERYNLDESIEGQLASSEDSGRPHNLKNILNILRLLNHPLLVQSQIKDPTSIHEEVLDISPKLVGIRDILIQCDIISPDSIDGVNQSNGSSAKSTSDNGSNNSRDKAEENDRLSIKISKTKVLIFTQRKEMLYIIKEYLLDMHHPEVSYMMLHGGIPNDKRHQVVNDFNASPDVDILLLTTRVGSLGLNLSSANIVIMVDHNWNPVVDMQAMDRCHRIGQKKVVNVYRILIKDSIEERVMNLQVFKTKLNENVIKTTNPETHSAHYASSFLDNFAEMIKANKDHNEAKAKKKEQQERMSMGGGPSGVPGLARELTDLWDDEYEEFDQ
eukprot:CAMPEP_0115028460 /NCGR_PEP_ID=MMETSP0216-20121206/36309_1 /TAXON_ID=223996 /ORGANISM="Protocruzia adherens, Strain Boccale" /LENGTH=1322 /DNA_ID=CAMNT_0002404639 /DNA_START=22 /DNA_END=3990 /DNA_ORIENTATION=-